MSPILCHAHVSWTWWTSSTGHVAVTEPFPGRVVVATWLKGQTRGMVPGVAPPSPTARLGHPGDVCTLWPTQTHLPLPMAPQWSDWAEGVLS